METDKRKILSTRDLSLAATLITLRFFMLGIDYQIEGDKNQPVGYFKFEETPQLIEAKAKYSQSLLMVEPKSFMTNVHALKAEIANAVKNPHSPIEETVRNQNARS